MPEATEWATAAGLFDGEGSVSLCLRRDGQIFSITSLGMTHQGTVNWLQETFGGAIREDRSISRRFPNRKKLWRWQLNGRKALPFLQGVFPYLRVKREKVQLVIEFLQLSLHSYDEEVRQARRRLLEAFRAAA